MLPKPSSYALYVQDSNLFLPPPKNSLGSGLRDLQVNPTSQWCLQVAVYMDSSQWFLEQLLSTDVAFSVGW